MQPRHVLLAAVEGPAPPHAGDPGEPVEHTTRVGAHGEAKAHGDLSGVWRVRLRQGQLPGPCDVRAVSPVRRHVVAGCADDVGIVAVVFVQRVRIDRRRAGLQPHARRGLRCGDGLADGQGGLDPAGHHLVQVRPVVAAVHRAAGEIHHRVGAVDLARPCALGTAVPAQGRVWNRATQNLDLMTRGDEAPCDDLTELAGTTGNEDAHRVSWITGPLNG